MTTLAEKLRDWMEARIKARAAYEALVEMDADVEYFTDDTARAYLRGYDDAKVEAAHTEMLLREAQDEIANAKARVQELAAELAVRMTVPETQPAAVGVVGAVRWAVIDRFYDLDGTITYKSRESAEFRAGQMHKSLDARVVAIVDPAQIVPLASANAEAWKDRFGVWHEYKDEAEAHGPATPLYPGLAQPVQVIEVHGNFQNIHGVPAEKIESMRKRWESHV
jgi:hypothetical protein